MNEGVPRKGDRMRTEKSIFPPPPKDPKLEAFLAEREAEARADQRRMFGPPKPRKMSPEELAAQLALGDKADKSYRTHNGDRIPGTNGYDSKEGDNTTH